MKSFVIALTLLVCGAAHGAEHTIGPATCLLINANPIPKETVKWDGPCKDGYAEGEGNLEWFVNGIFNGFYKGALVRGVRHGYGYNKRPDGVQYEGHFVGGAYEGRGILLAGFGDRYEGEFKGGLFDGLGTMTYGLGGRYEGYWKAGSYHGKGKATFAGGQVLEGDFGMAAVAVQQTPEPAQAAGRHTLKHASSSRTTVGWGAIAFDASYGRLTPNEKNMVRNAYPLLHENDEPPYPFNGTKRVVSWFYEAITKVQATGPLRMTVLVDAEGNAESVEVFETPHKDMSKLVAEIVMAEKFKPAVCSGKPCAMMFPYAVDFALE